MLDSRRILGSSRDFLLVSVVHLSISQLSELTGRERRTVSQKLVDVPHIAGDRGAMLYKSVEALPLIRAVRQLDGEDYPLIHPRWRGIDQATTFFGFCHLIK